MLHQYPGEDVEGDGQQSEAVQGGKGVLGHRDGVHVSAQEHKQRGDGEAEGDRDLQQHGQEEEGADKDQQRDAGIHDCSASFSSSAWILGVGLPVRWQTMR